LRNCSDTTSEYDVTPRHRYDLYYTRDETCYTVRL